MTALTLQFEDNLYSNLKQSADNIGYSIDNYILYVLARVYDANKEAKLENDIDSMLSSMQFDSGRVPENENGKGALAEMKYF